MAGGRPAHLGGQHLKSPRIPPTLFKGWVQVPLNFLPELGSNFSQSNSFPRKDMFNALQCFSELLSPLKECSTHMVHEILIEVSRESHESLTKLLQSYTRSLQITHRATCSPVKLSQSNLLSPTITTPTRVGQRLSLCTHEDSPSPPIHCLVTNSLPTHAHHCNLHHHDHCPFYL
jgi:hypothetical protein